MKIELTITLDLPDEWASWTDAELRQNLYDGYIQQPVHGHKETAMVLAAHGSSSAGIADSLLWADICDKANWSFRRV